MQLPLGKELRLAFRVHARLKRSEQESPEDTCKTRQVLQVGVLTSLALPSLSITPTAFSGRFDKICQSTSPTTLELLEFSFFRYITYIAC
jgi:hypothetical protein